MNATNINSGTVTALNWQDRPTEVQEKIDEKFGELACQLDSSWHVNGSDHYHLCRIDEHAWFTTFIKNRYPKRKDFYAMDIGAGNFFLAKALAETINQDSDLPEDISVTIVSLRGESIQGEKCVQTQEGKCLMLYFGAFKVENLFEEFKNRNFDFENKVDLILSSWTFRHLIDPMGTLIQTYSLLRPETGLLLMDDFFLFYENQTLDQNTLREMSQKNMIPLLLDSKVTFMIKENCLLQSIQMAFKRKNFDPLHIALDYKTVLHCRDIYSKHVTVFKADDTQNSPIHIPKFDPGLFKDEVIYGNQNLHKELQPFLEDFIKFYPLDKIS